MSEEPKRSFECCVNGVTLASSYTRMEAARHDWEVAIACIDLLTRDIQRFEREVAGSDSWDGPVARAVRAILDLAGSTIAKRANENRRIITELANGTRHLQTAHHAIKLPNPEELAVEIGAYASRFHSNGEYHRYADGDFQRRVVEIVCGEPAWRDPIISLEVLILDAGLHPTIPAAEQYTALAIQGHLADNRRAWKAADKAFAALEKSYGGLKFPEARPSRLPKDWFDLDGGDGDGEKGAGTDQAAKPVDPSSVAPPPFPGMAGQQGSGLPTAGTPSAGTPTAGTPPGGDLPTYEPPVSPPYEPPESPPYERGDYEGLAGYDPAALGATGSIGGPVAGMGGATPIAGTQLAGRVGAPGAGMAGSMYPLVPMTGMGAGRPGDQGHGQSIIKPEKQPELEARDDDLPKWLIA